MIKDYSSGIILYYRFPNKIKYLLLKHRQGHWTFCKGHKNSGERKIDAAIRELEEETGITKFNFLKKSVMVRETYFVKNGSGVKKLKSNDYYIAESKKKNVKIDGSEILKFRWCGYNAALKQITFNQSKTTLRKANKFIESHLNGIK